MRKNLFFIFISLLFTACSHQIEVGDCYSFENNGERKYVVVTKIEYSHVLKDTIYEVTPVYSSSKAHLENPGIIILTNPSTPKRVCSYVLQTKLFGKSLDEFKFEKHLTIPTDLHGVMGFMPNNMKEVQNTHGLMSLKGDTLKVD
jgi:hypothetical protein